MLDVAKHRERHLPLDGLKDLGHIWIPSFWRSHSWMPFKDANVDGIHLSSNKADYLQWWGPCLRIIHNALKRHRVHMAW